MESLQISGPAQLSGSVTISGAKNACLPIMAACLLSDQEIILENVPDLRDVRTMMKLLGHLGSQWNENEKGVYSCHTPELSSHEAMYDLVKTMRASILVLGPLLARKKKAVVSLPGGCAIGPRPIDIHLQGLKKMGVTFTLQSGYVEAHTDELKGAQIELPFPSVGATENILMAATLAKGVTIISNAACEPEICDLAEFLNSMGAQIQGAGTSQIVIEGVKVLSPSRHKIIGDRIEAATYVIAALMTHSHITLKEIETKYLKRPLDLLENMGAQLRIGPNEIEVFPSKNIQGATVETAPYPGIPTDIQAQLSALGLVTNTPMVITEKIFENRFMHIPELRRLGANISLNNNTCKILGTTSLTGAPVMCTDLRASAALVLAALIVPGKTEIHRIYHLDRGYEKMDEKLQKLGVNIERIQS